MYRTTILLMALSVFILSETQAESANSADKDDTLKITVTNLDISDKILKLSYEIRNDSKQDVWICNNIVVLPKLPFEVYLDEDNQTLLVRRRLDVPFQVFTELPLGRYVRLPPGEELIESLSFILPVYRRSVLWGGRGGRRSQDIEFARRLVVEIGFYVEDLPRMVRGILEDTEKKINDVSSKSDPEIAIKNSFGGLFGFIELNENLNMSEEVLIPYSHQALKGEQVIRITIDDVHIPYKEKEEWADISPPNLRDYTYAEIQYQPSMLNYFFPYAAERSLLSPEEMQFLRSLKTIVSADKEGLKAFANSVSERTLAGGIVREKNIANVVFYRDSERLTSFKVYNNETIVTEGKRFIYPNDLSSLKRLTPPIKPFMFRAECARNLRVLWNRLNLYQMIDKSEMTYPALTEWCDAVVKVYRTRIMNDEYIRRQFKCPSVAEGKCHYAMNPNYKPDSPPDMVLLFETKAGWNQHGGPELFTFDNHDPKGGCVLLNDGTVKFIRTKEELRQLRWLYPGG